jgi:hypothetical protein
LTDDFEVWLDEILSDLEKITNSSAIHTHLANDLRKLELEVDSFFKFFDSFSPPMRERMASRVSDLKYDLDIARSLVRPSLVTRDFDAIVDDIVVLIESGGRFGNFDPDVWRRFFDRLVALRPRLHEVYEYEADLSGPLEGAIAYIQSVRNEHRLPAFTPQGHIRRVTRSRRR